MSVLPLMNNSTLAGFLGMILANFSSNTLYYDFQPFHLASNNAVASLANKQLAFTYYVAVILKTTG